MGAAVLNAEIEVSTVVFKLSNEMEEKFKGNIVEGSADKVGLIVFVDGGDDDRLNKIEILSLSFPVSRILVKS